MITYSLNSKIVIETPSNIKLKHVHHLQQKTSQPSHRTTVRPSRNHYSGKPTKCICYSLILCYYLHIRVKTMKRMTKMFEIPFASRTYSPKRFDRCIIRYQIDTRSILTNRSEFLIRMSSTRLNVNVDVLDVISLKWWRFITHHHRNVFSTRRKQTAGHPKPYKLFS